MFYAFILLPEQIGGGGGSIGHYYRLKKDPIQKKEIQKIRFKIQVCGS